MKQETETETETLMNLIHDLQIVVNELGKRIKEIEHIVELHSLKLDSLSKHTP